MKKRISEITEYQPGTLRTIRRFAYFPRRIKEWKIWLMWYDELWIYRMDQIPGIANGENKTVIKKYWDKVDERL